MSEWPLIEEALADHLASRTGFPWRTEGGSVDRLPLGVVQRSGGSGDLDLEDVAAVEVTLFAASRSGAWELARRVHRAFASLSPGGIVPTQGEPIYVDEARQPFGYAIDPDRGTSAYRVATATYSLTLRPQDTEAVTQP